MTITLYHMPQAPPSRAALLAARAIGVDVNVKLVNLFAGEQNTPEFLKMNPLHTVPTLVDGELVICESHAIACYLANRYGKDDSLYPKDPKKRAMVDQKLYFDAEKLYTRLRAVCFPVFFQGANTVSDEAKVAVHEALGFMEEFLAPTGWVAGDGLTIADCACVASVSTYVAEGFDISKYKNVVAWMERCRSQIPDYHEINQKGLDNFKTVFQSKVLPGQI